MAVDGSFWEGLRPSRSAQHDRKRIVPTANVCADRPWKLARSLSLRAFNMALAMPPPLANRRCALSLLAFIYNIPAFADFVNAPTL